MNIAFSTLVIFLLVLPGVLFRYAYRKGFWRSPVQLGTLPEEISSGILFALIIQLIGVAVVRYAIGWHIGFDALLMLLTGWAPVGEAQTAEYIASVSEFPFRILSYLLLSNLVFYFAGYGCHKLVRSLKIDLRFDSFRFNNEWYYLFSGEARVFDYAVPERTFSSIKQVLEEESIDLVYLTCQVETGGTAWLYYGILSDYLFDKKGNLDLLILQAAHRKKLSEVPHQPKEAEPPLQNIRGHYFVLRYPEVRNLNIEYISLPT